MKKGAAKTALLVENIMVEFNCSKWLEKKMWKTTDSNVS